MARASTLTRRATILLASAAIALASHTGLAKTAVETEAPDQSNATIGLELLMVEQRGCHWCAAWDREIGPIYVKTPFATQAPLRKVNIHSLSEIYGEFDRPPVYTPSFILLKEGREVGRIEGYPGENFFWPMLTTIVSRASAPE